MTDAEIIAEFERREAAANRTPEGADHPAILREVSLAAGRDLAEVRRLILDATFARPL